MKIHQSSGFSLVELLAVIGIFLVLSTFSVIAWNSFGPTMALNSAAEGLGDSLELCMHKALTQKNEFFLILNHRERLYRTNDNVTLQFPASSYVVVNDDGWAPTGSNRTRKYNFHTQAGGPLREYRADYLPDSPDFATNWRNNNMVESREIFRGPIRLGRAIFFQQYLEAQNTPMRIVFSHSKPKMYWHGQNVNLMNPIPENSRREDTAYIYLSNQHYRPGDDSKDNKAHLRTIRVMSDKIEVYRPK